MLRASRSTRFVFSSSRAFHFAPFRVLSRFPLSLGLLISPSLSHFLVFSSPSLFTFPPQPCASQFYPLSRASHFPPRSGFSFPPPSGFSFPPSLGLLISPSLSHFLVFSSPSLFSFPPHPCASPFYPLSRASHFPLSLALSRFLLSITLLVPPSPLHFPVLPPPSSFSFPSCTFSFPPSLGLLVFPSFSGC